MSRRSLGTSAALAGVLLSSGFLPLLGTASANTCASWTDTKDDATTNQLGQEPLRDSNMDIVSTSLTTVGTNVVATIKVQDLLENGYSDFGDQYFVAFRVAGSGVRMVAERTEIGDKAYLANAGGTANGVATMAIDHNESAIVITATQAELDKSAGKASAGIAVTDLVSSTNNQANSQTFLPYDGSQAPAGTTFTIGAQCTPVIAPAVVPMPEGTCNDYTDIPNDGTPVIVAPATTPNEPVLDITSVALNSTPDAFYAYLKVSQLAAKPTYFQGDRFEVSFKSGAGKIFAFSVGRMGAGKSVTTYPTRGTVGGNPDVKLKVRGVFDTAKNTVVIITERAGIDAVNGAPIADGADVTEVFAKTYGMQPALSSPADTAQVEAAAARVYKFGTGKCFPPPPGVLTNVGRTTVQYTDAAAVSAKLTTAGGTALSGKTVSFSVGSRTVTAKTNGSGVASASLNPGVPAGTKYSLVTKFAGDSSAGAVTLTTPFSVSVEKTKLALRVAKSGSNRTVTATLTDDDRRAVAGQTVTWYINGKKVSTARTGSAGTVVLKTAKPTQTVKVVFSGVSGKYAGSSVQQKV